MEYERLRKICASYDLDISERGTTGPLIRRLVLDKWAEEKDRLPTSSDMSYHINKIGNNIAQYKTGKPIARIPHTKVKGGNRKLPRHPVLYPGHPEHHPSKIQGAQFRGTGKACKTLPHRTETDQERNGKDRGKVRSEQQGRLPDQVLERLHG